MDLNLINFAFSKVLLIYKASHDDTKILLKRLAYRLMPPRFDYQRKQGFSIPLGDWLKSGPFRDLFWETLNSNDCIFDRRTVTFLKGQDLGFVTLRESFH